MVDTNRVKRPYNRGTVTKFKKTTLNRTQQIKKNSVKTINIKELQKYKVGLKSNLNMSLKKELITKKDKEIVNNIEQNKQQRGFLGLTHTHMGKTIEIWKID